MYCKNCGKQLADDAFMCPNCGAQVAKINVMVSEASPKAKSAGGERSWVVAILLCFFLGEFGVHSFYAGKIGIGIIQLLTLGGCGIWTMIDLIMILVGAYKDADGMALKY